MALRFVIRRGGETPRCLVPLDVPSNASSIAKRRLEHAILAIVQSSPGFDQGMRKNRVSVNPKLTENRLILSDDSHG
jgi:hypothetical protein